MDEMMLACYADLNVIRDCHRFCTPRSCHLVRHRYKGIATHKCARCLPAVCWEVDKTEDVHW